MERLKERIRVASATVTTLEEALAIAVPSTLERDGAIQRFEYSFEAVWKAGQRYLSELEGTVVNSPKQCMRALGRVGVLSVDETRATLEMVDDGNNTVHTYNEALAAVIHARLPGHAVLLRAMVSRIETAGITTTPGSA